MFFYLAKIGWMIIQPLNFLWILGVLGLSLRIFWKKTGNAVILNALSLFLIFGFFPVGHNLLVFLETRYDRPENLNHVDGIIVLGGAFESYISEHNNNAIALNNNVERIIDFVDLARRYPQAKLVFSGGSGDMRNPEKKEADDAAQFFTMIGFDDTRVTYERASKNTYQNAVFSKELVEPQAGETWLLITSAYHMPRSMAVFEKIGWSVIAYNSDFNTDRAYTILPTGLNVTANFYNLERSLREFKGMFVYYFSGKSTWAFPSFSVR